MNRSLGTSITSDSDSTSSSTVLLNLINHLDNDDEDKYNNDLFPPSSTPRLRTTPSSIYTDYRTTRQNVLSDNLTTVVTSLFISPSGLVELSPLQPHPSSTSPEKSVPLSTSTFLQPSFHSRLNDFTTTENSFSSRSSLGLSNEKNIFSVSNGSVDDLISKSDDDTLSSLRASSVTWNHFNNSSELPKVSSLDDNRFILESSQPGTVISAFSTPNFARSTDTAYSFDAKTILDEVSIHTTELTSLYKSENHSYSSVTSSVNDLISNSENGILSSVREVSSWNYSNYSSKLHQVSSWEENDSVVISERPERGVNFSTGSTTHFNSTTYTPTVSVFDGYSSITDSNDGLYSSDRTHLRPVTPTIEVLLPSTLVSDKLETPHRTLSSRNSHFSDVDYLQSDVFLGASNDNVLKTEIPVHITVIETPFLEISSSPAAQQRSHTRNFETSAIDIIPSYSSWDAINLSPTVVSDSIKSFAGEITITSVDGSIPTWILLSSPLPSISEKPVPNTKPALFSSVVSSIYQQESQDYTVESSAPDISYTTQIDIDSSSISSVVISELSPTSTNFNNFVSPAQTDFITSIISTSPSENANVKNTDHNLTSHKDIRSLAWDATTPYTDQEMSSYSDNWISDPTLITPTTSTVFQSGTTKTHVLESDLAPTKVIMSTSGVMSTPSPSSMGDPTATNTPLVNESTSTQQPSSSSKSQTLSSSKESTSPPSPFSTLSSLSLSPSSTVPDITHASSSTAVPDNVILTQPPAPPVQPTQTLTPDNNYSSKSSHIHYDAIIDSSSSSVLSPSLSSTPPSSSLTASSSSTFSSSTTLTPTLPSSSISSSLTSSSSLLSSSQPVSKTKTPSLYPHPPTPNPNPDSLSTRLSSPSYPTSDTTPAISVVSSVIIPVTTIRISSTSSTLGGFSSTSNNATTMSGKVDSTSSDGFMSGSGPIIIGSACGALAVVIVIVIAIICAMRKRKKRKKSNGTENAADELWVDMSGRDQRYKLPSPSLMTLASLEEDPFHPDKNENDTFYKAIHDYTALQEGHLNLSKGDKVQLLETADGGWCRGVSKKDGLSGWFPNSYVVEAQSSDKDRSLSREGSPSKALQHQVSSFQIKKTENEYATPVVFDAVPSYASLERKQGNNDVASWVKMASSVSLSSIPSVDSAATGSALEDLKNPSMKDRPFRAIYAYKPVCKGEMGLREGELVVCKETDKNGWMLGFKPQTKEKGWFPAVYVDEVPGQGDHLDYTSVPSTYEILESNKLHNTSQAWTGIEHKSISEYSNEIPGDLTFTLGDVIIVYQTLANGWWFGEKEDKSGWFPGSFVEMIPTDDPCGAASNSAYHNGENTSRPSTPYRNSPSLDEINIVLRQKSPQNNTLSPPSPSNSAMNSPRESIASSIYSENDKLPLMTHKPIGNGNSKNIRPNRKAPAPPPVMALKAKLANNQNIEGTNSLRRPARPAPAPPKMKDIEKSLTNQQNGHGSSDILNNGTEEDKKPKKPVVIINGKIPKLIKTMPSKFDDKSLNPMIRPAKRGFAPTPDQYKEEKKRTRLAPNSAHHTTGSCRNSFTSDYTVPPPISPLNIVKKNHYMDNHNLTKSSPTSSVDSGMDVKMQRPYTPTYPSPLTRSFNEFDRITHGERESSISSLQRSNTSTPTAFHRLSPRNSKNLNNDSSSPYMPSASPSFNNGYATPSIVMNDDKSSSTPSNSHDDSISTMDTTLIHDNTDDSQELKPSVSTFLSPNSFEPRYKSNKNKTKIPRPAPKPSPRLDKANKPKAPTPTHSNNNNIESDKHSPELSQLSKDTIPKNTFRPINEDNNCLKTDQNGLKLLRYSEGTELDNCTLQSNSTCDSINGLSPNSHEHSLASPVFGEAVIEETTAL